MKFCTKTLQKFLISHWRGKNCSQWVLLVATTHPVPSLMMRTRRLIVTHWSYCGSSQPQCRRTISKLPKRGRSLRIGISFTHLMQRPRQPWGTHIFAWSAYTSRVIAYGVNVCCGKQQIQHGSTRLKHRGISGSMIVKI